MTYSSTILADAPIAYYHLDETSAGNNAAIANSGSGGGSATVSINGGTITTGGAGAGTIGGKSFHFNNNIAYLTQTITQVSTANLTLEFWHKWDTAYGAKPSSAQQIATYAGNGHYVSLFLGATQNQILVQITGSTYPINKTITGVNPTDGAWHHWVITQNAGNLTVYVDGVSVATGTGAPTTVNTSATIQIGGLTSTGGDCWIDEPAAYPAAFTASQALAHYNAGVAAASTPITVTPPIMDIGTLTVPAPVVNIVNNDDTVVAPVMTASLATATPVVTGSASITDAVPAMTLSLATATPVVTLSSSDISTADRGGDPLADQTSGRIVFSGVGGQENVGMYFQFPNPAAPAGKTVSAANLKLTLLGGTFAAGTTVGMKVYRVTSAWTEGDYTATSHDPVAIASATFPVSAGSTVNIDLTSVAKSWVSGVANYGIVIIADGTGAVSSVDSSVAYVASREYTTAAYRPTLTSSFVDIPPTPVTVNAPVMTASLADPAPVVTAQKNVSSTATIVDLGTVDLVAANDSVSTNVTTVAPVVTASLSFLGGQPFNPDYLGRATAIAAGIATPNANGFIEYDVLVQAPATYLGNLENEIASVNLTTNRLTVATPMSLSLKWPGIYIESADRYLAKIATTLDQDDIWYKMDEASGNRAIDSEYGYSVTGGVSTPVWQQSGYYVGSPTFRISDGPELRPAVHFDGIDDYMVVGPYTQNDKWQDAVTNDVTSQMAVTIEFSIRTSQTDGVVFIGGGAGVASVASTSASYTSLPHANGNELRLEAGYLTIANKAGTKIKARKFISDGQWHHIVMAIPSGNAFVPNPTDPIQFDGRSPSYLAVDGQPTLVRYGNFLGDTQSWGNYWLPFVVGARTDDAAWNLDSSGNPIPDTAGSSGYLSMDMRDFIVRLNSYQQVKDTEVIYYEWSNSMVLSAEPITASLSTVAPFKVKGNMKKMLALYGLPYGYDQYFMPLDLYTSTLSGMVIENFGGVLTPPNGSTFGAHTPVYQQVKTFTVGDYLVFPVDYTGGQNGYSDTNVTSVAGVLNRSSSFMKETADGIGYGGFADDSTGLPRFINLQDDLVNVQDFDVVTVVNYPWETPMAAKTTQGSSPATAPGASSHMPNDAQLCQSSMGLSNVEWTVARNNLRDSILEAAYDGVNLWVGEYHMAQHLGFIGNYDVHDFGHLTGIKNTHAVALDAAHGRDSSGYLGSIGEFYPGPQLMGRRRVTSLIAGLTDLPTTEIGDQIEGWSYDRWLADGDFLATDLVHRPNGLQVGDLCIMGGNGFSGIAETLDIPFTAPGVNYGFWNQSAGARGDTGNPFVRTSIISARPDGVIGTPVTREMTGYYSDNGVWIDNPYKDNVLTIAAEVGTVVRGRAIAGRAFIELMETNITPVFAAENQPLPSAQQTVPGVVLRYSPSGFQSTWETDTRRDKQVMATINRTMLTAVGGGFGVENTAINYMNFTETPVIYHRRETMHSRGLNWLAQTRTLNAGDVVVYQTAFTLTLTEPSAQISKTSNETVQVSAIRLDMEVRQPKNYLSGDVEERTLPMELFLDMRGRGAVVPASAMTLDLSAVGPVIRAATEIISVFLDADNGPITLFLKEDN